MPRHDHDQVVEVVLVRAGSILHEVRGQARHEGAGTITLVRPSDDHALTARGPVSWLNIAVHARHLTAVDAWAEGRVAALLAAPAPPRLVLDPEQVAVLANRVMVLAGRLADDPVAARMVLSTALEPWLLPRIEPEPPPRLTAALAAVLAEAPMRWSTARLAALYGCSDAHLSRLVRAHLGTTPTAWLRERRLDAVAARLVLMEEPLAACFLAVGFLHPNHAHTYFRARFGCSPADYRSRHRQAW